MKTSITYITRSAILTAVLATFALVVVAKEKPPLKFSELHITLEQNATDGDTEVVLFAKGQAAGLEQLVITAPDGRRVADIKADCGGIGLREFHLESAEPPDLKAVLNSFPEGAYAIAGKTVKGETINGTAQLSHQIAPPATLLTPKKKQVVPVDQVTLSWSAVPSAKKYIVEFNNKDNGAEFTFQIYPPTTSLALPANLIQAGSKYKFGVGVQTATGNITFVESDFTTAP